MVPPPIATVTSGPTISPGRSISGMATDAGGPGVLGIALYYYNQGLKKGGLLSTQCNGCGPGHVNASWSYTPKPGGPLPPGSYVFTAQAVDTGYTYGAGSTLQQVTIVGPTAAITSGPVISSGQSIIGTGSDTGGPGVAAVILYYYNPSTGQGGWVATTCNRCGAGQTDVSWSYTYQAGGPLKPGSYLIAAQAVDTTYNFGGASPTQQVTIQ
jgi:hypothetical protein